MIRQISKNEARRTKHVKNCMGYEDCECFGMYASYAELRRLQLLASVGLSAAMSVEPPRNQEKES